MPAYPANTPTIEIADLIVAYLHSVGIEYVFGVPGGAVEPIYNALARSQRQGGPRPIVARHEAGAAFMADGYARETGKIGVCIATSGPGATNLITGVSCSYDNSVPVLAITGQPALPSFGKGALQESACTGINTVGMFRHCTRYNSLVSHRDQVENKLVNALMRANQSPQGPVHLSFPVDILRCPTALINPSFNLNARLAKHSMVDEASLSMLMDELSTSRKIVVIIGGSCGEAVESILQFVELTNAIFVTTPDGKGLINPRHPSYHGVFGFAGHYAANAALIDDPELVVAVGTSLGEWTSSAWCDTVLNDRLIHIDADDEHLLRSPMARLHIRGRISAVFTRLVQLLQQSDYKPLPRTRGKPAELLRERDKFESDATPIKPQRLMRELSLRCPPTVRFYADAGNSTCWAIQYLEPHDRRLRPRSDPQFSPQEVAGERRADHAGWLRVMMDFAPMGWAIGAAIGGAAGNPEYPTVCITGDGSYLMNGQEITVAAAEKLCVIFVILNDAALGMVKHGQRLAGAEPIAFELPLVDFAMMAESMGIPGHIIRSPQDLDALDFDAMFARKGPTLLDVRIDGEEVPPMNLRMKTLGTVK